MAAIGVSCNGTSEAGWACEVTIRDGDAEISRHRVRVRAADLARLAPGDSTPDSLLEASFAFLLEREPPESILRSFDLTDIGRYFPDYELTIRRG